MNLAPTPSVSSPRSAGSPGWYSGLAKVMVAAWVSGLVACSSPVKLNDTPVEDRQAMAVDSAADAAKAAAEAAAAAAAAAKSTVATVKAGGSADANTTGWPAQRVVYFDFDSFALREDAKPTVEGHAKVLVANKARKLMIEGHTDERGGREYNLALGQKRAEAVSKSLVLLGASEAQVEAVSFGKERPADEGHDEPAWAKNRRAELKERK
jgi:peptidoglycan-associated lipoprotein